MDQGRRFKNIFQSKAKGSRTGRPKMRWLKDEEKDLWQIKIKRWRQKAADRKELASVIMKTKAIRGPKIQGVRKYPRLYGR
jgi:hypothetical protein